MMVFSLELYAARRPFPFSMAYLYRSMANFYRPTTYLALLTQLHLSGCPVNWDFLFVKYLSLSGSSRILLSSHATHPFVRRMKGVLDIILPNGNHFEFGLDHHSCLKTMFTVSYILYMLHQRNFSNPVLKTTRVPSFDYLQPGDKAFYTFDIDQSELDDFAPYYKSSCSSTALQNPTSDGLLTLNSTVGTSPVFCGVSVNAV